MDNSQEVIELTQPLSPVLSSTKNSKKFMKTFISNKRNAGIKLSEKFKGEYLSQNEKEGDFLKSQSETHSKDRKENSDIQLNRKIKLSKTSNERVCSSFGFQTASGKQVFSNTSCSEYADALFKDIFDPTSVHNRKNKYNFLPRNLSSVLTENENSEDDEFLGFKREECISSKEKLEKMLQLLNAIYISNINSDGGDRKESTIEFHISESKRKRDFEQYIEVELCKIKQPKNSKMNEIYVNSENQKSQCQIEENYQQVQFQRSHKFANSLISKNSDDYNNIHSNTAIVNKNISTSLNQEQENTRETSCNVNLFKEKSKQPEFKNSDAYKYNSNSDIAKSDFFQPNSESKLQFATASDKQISTSSAAFSKANRFLKDIQDSEFPQEHTSEFPQEDTSEFPQEHTSEFPQEPNTENILQFSKSPDRNISGSSASLSKASIIKKMQNSEVPQDSSLFLRKGNLPMSLIHEKIENKDLKFKTFDCTNDLEVPKEYTPNLVSKTDNDFLDSTFLDVPHTETLGFSTASGKEIEILPASLAKINNIFKEMTDIDDFTKDNISSRFLSASNCTSTKDSGKELKSSKVQKEEVIQNSNFVTPVRDISKRKRLGNSLKKDGKFSDVALNRVKSLFGDMNFDDLKLPGFLKIESPSDFSLHTPVGSNRKVSTPQYLNSSISKPIRQVRRSVFDNNDSFLNDVPQEYNYPFLIQKPTAGDLTSWVDELERQKKILENKLVLISKKQEALSFQIHANLIPEENKPLPSFHKKMNKINLKDIHNLEMQSDCSEKVNNVILQINPQNAILIHFNCKGFDTATVTTEDGCTLIPTQQGLLGLSEIEPAFSSMPDIKKTLIPKGWIRNHYKWIIWKLGSYERFFPSTLGGCFTIDNVIKQLKYRYYRELYCAERPALRKIYELDDISQKRMILCISNIFKNGDSIELELTDGWYCIRTLIDEPLCHEINTKKIRIGSKLITSGAELLNCEGCYPLETEMAQKVRLKINFNSTRRATWFSKLGYQKISMPLLIKINDANPAGGVIGATKVYIMRTYPLIYREKTKSSVVWRNQNAENKMFQEYENQCFKEYEDIVGDNSITKNADVINRRHVCPIFQMIVIDVLGDKTKPYKCTVWDAAESHIEQLREHQITLIYNLTIRSADGLSCNKKTRFDITKENLIEYTKYKRKYVALAKFDVMLYNSIFGFFDTVGFVVKINVGEENQHLWLTDTSKSILLVNITEGPNNCLLLHRIQENQPVVVCNLSLKDNFQEYVMATAGLNTIVTKSSQYEFLQEELVKLKTMDKTEFNILMKDVKMRINNSQNGNSSKSTSHSSTSGNTLNFSRVTSTDIVMSMINIDDL